MRKKDLNMYDNIIKEIKNNPNVTQKYLSEKYNYTERTIRRYLKELKDQNIIKIEDYGIRKQWKIL